MQHYLQLVSVDAPSCSLSATSSPGDPKSVVAHCTPYPQVRQRALVKGFREREDGIYALTLRQHLGGRRDGYWYADSLVCDSLETD